MRYTLLLSFFLCTVYTAHSMEIEKVVNKNEEIYTFFKKQQGGAKKIIPSNQHELTSIFKYGIEQNNPDFIQWLFATKKPLFDEHCIQEAYKHSSNPKITYLLVDYITTGKNKRQQELNAYITQQTADIIQEYPELNKAENKDSICIIS
jgi:hypothetical protein